MAVIENEYSSLILTGEEAAEWDRYSIQNYGVESRLLMAWAGYSVFAHIRATDYFNKSNTVHLLTGSGNNAGDAYVLAWQILTGTNKKVIIWKSKDPKTDDAKYFYELCVKFKEEHKELDKVVFNDLGNIQSLDLNSKDIVVDGLFGTGLNKPLAENYQDLFSMVNKIKDIVRIAIDISSGVIANGDNFTGVVFSAHYTYTFGAYKVGHLLEPGILHSGEVTVFPIGFAPLGENFNSKIDNQIGEKFGDSNNNSIINDDKFYKKISKRRLIRNQKIPALRKPEGHKYSSGLCTVVGGSEGMEGAAIMSAMSFISLGGGLSKIVSTSKEIIRALSDSPELMILSQPEVSKLESTVKELILSKEREQVVVVGPGLAEELSETFWKWITSIKFVHLIIDGSALSHLYKNKNIIKSHQLGSLTLTPHKIEAGYLLNKDVENSRNTALEISNIYNCSVYLKGPGGIIVLKNHQNSESEADEPGKNEIEKNETDVSEIEEIYVASKQYELSTGGTGDVLTGVIANMIHRVGKERALETALSIFLEASNEVIQKEGLQSLGQNIKITKKSENTFRDLLTPTELIKALKKIIQEKYAILQ